MTGGFDMKSNVPRKFDFDRIGIIDDSTTIFGTTVGVFNNLLEEHFQEMFREIELAREKRKPDPASQEDK